MAHTFEHKLDAWATNGTKSAPSSTLKSTGFVGGMKPPASVFNYQWDKIAKAITELQQYALTEDPSGGKWQNLATVATSGSYNDLLDKPALKAVATSGNYEDLTGKPTPYVHPATHPATMITGLADYISTLGYIKVATGSYVGDGKGKGVNYTKFEYMIDDSNTKTINLPFSPTLLLLTCKQYSGVMIMYPDTYYNADGGVKSNESGTSCAFTGTKLVVTGNTSTTSPIGGSGNTSGNKYTYIVFA